MMYVLRVNGKQRGLNLRHHLPALICLRASGMIMMRRPARRSALVNSVGRLAGHDGTLCSYATTYSAIFPFCTNNSR